NSHCFFDQSGVWDKLMLRRIMATISYRHGIQFHIPVIGDIHAKSPLAYRATRAAVRLTNAVQMALAEAYIHGVEVPDSVLRTFFNTCMPIAFKYFPALLAPYEWVLRETDQIAEGAKDLMK